MEINVEQLAGIIDLRIQQNMESLIAGAAEAMEKRFAEMLEGYAAGAMGTVWAADFEAQMQRQYENVVLMEAERIQRERDEELMDEADAAEHGPVSKESKPPVEKKILYVDAEKDGEGEG